MKINKYFTFAILAITFLTSCTSTQNQQPIVNNTIKPFDYGDIKEISLKQYDKVKDYSIEIKKLGFSSGLSFVPSEIINAQDKVRKVSKDNTITRNEYNSLNIEQNIKELRFLVAKILKLEEIKK